MGTFTDPDGWQLGGAVAIDPDHSSDRPIVMVDFLPGNYGYVEKLQCSPDGACENFGAVGPSLIDGDTTLGNLLDHGFSVGHNGDFYASTKHCGDHQCGYDVVRQCFPTLEEVQV